MVFSTCQFQVGTPHPLFILPARLYLSYPPAYHSYPSPCVSFLGFHSITPTLLHSGHCVSLLSQILFVLCKCPLHIACTHISLHPGAHLNVFSPAHPHHLHLTTFFISLLHLRTISDWSEILQVRFSLFSDTWLSFSCHFPVIFMSFSCHFHSYVLMPMSVCLCIPPVYPYLYVPLSLCHPYVLSPILFSPLFPSFLQGFE
jgi:hypothetical protein